MTILDQVRTRRTLRGVSQRRLAASISTSQGRVSTYENGSSVPSVDIAERAATALDGSLVILDASHWYDVIFDDSLLDDYRASGTRPDQVTHDARRHAAEVVETELHLDGLELRLAAISTLLDGITVAGDAVAVARARRIRDWLRSAQGLPTDSLLAMAADQTWITDDHRGDHVSRAASFMARAIVHGADHTHARIRASEFLVRHGHPWPMVAWDSAEDYRRARAIADSGIADTLIRITFDPRWSL